MYVARKERTTTTEEGSANALLYLGFEGEMKSVKCAGLQNIDQAETEQNREEFAIKEGKKTVLFHRKGSRTQHADFCEGKAEKGES